MLHIGVCGCSQTEFLSLREGVVGYGDLFYCQWQLRGVSTWALANFRRLELNHHMFGEWIDFMYNLIVFFCV